MFKPEILVSINMWQEFLHTCSYKYIYGILFLRFQTVNVQLKLLENFLIPQTMPTLEQVSCFDVTRSSIHVHFIILIESETLNIYHYKFYLDRTFLLYNAQQTYEINCCGYISQWDIDAVNIGDLSAQIWRSVGGNWVLVGENRLTVSGNAYLQMLIPRQMKTVFKN